MRKLLATIFLLLALVPSVHSVLEAWEHIHHSHAAASEEKGTHMHSKEAHCQVDHYAFLSTPWEALRFHVARPTTYPQRVQTGYTRPYAARFFRKTDTRGPPYGNLSANV